MIQLEPGRRGVLGAVLVVVLLGIIIVEGATILADQAPLLMGPFLIVGLIGLLWVLWRGRHS